MSRLVVGIDEVGYGPILGPLVVSSCSFLIHDYPEEYPEVDLWYRLQESIGKQRKFLGNRLLVTDSKKTYSRSLGIKYLEKTVLTFVNQIIDFEGKRFSQLLSLLSSDALQQLEKYPWSNKIYSPLPEIDQNAWPGLARNMEDAGVDFIDARCCYVDVDQFNHLVRLSNNKSTIVSDAVLYLTSQLIAATQFLNIKDVTIISDRLGGRIHYDSMLSNLVGFEIEEGVVEKKVSRYKLVSKNRTLDIQFKVKADDTFLPVALASMFGKYVREKVMMCMNEFLIELQPGLKPTAGYWTDGLRFLEDLDAGGTLDAAKIPVGRMVRIK